MNVRAIVGVVCAVVAAVSDTGIAQGNLKVDPASAGAIAGHVKYVGARTMPERLNMSSNPYCAKVAGTVRSEAILVDRDNNLANAFETTSVSFTLPAGRPR